MNGEPKPCPFCGWGTIVDEAFWLPNKHICKCNSCGARTRIYPTWDDAVKAWNRRAEQTVIRDFMVRQTEGEWIVSDDKYFHTCQFCNADVDVSMGTGIFVDNDEVSHMNYCPNCGSRMKGADDETD